MGAAGVWGDAAALATPIRDQADMYRAAALDRDIVSAGLAARVELADAGDPRTARVDYRLAHALREAGLPARVGRFSQPAPATTIRCWIGQDRQPPPPGLCCC